MNSMCVRMRLPFSSFVVARIGACRQDNEKGEPLPPAPVVCCVTAVGSAMSTALSFPHANVSLVRLTGYPRCGMEIRVVLLEQWV